MPIPYIGITDFASPEEVLRMAAVMQRAKRNNKPPHRLMVGVMMSHKTLHNLSTKWTNVWPKKEDYQHIFVEAPEVFNTLHFADYDLNNDLVDDLIRAVGLCGRHLHAVQLDMIWPKPAAVKQFTILAEATRQLSLVLQVGKDALSEIRHNADTLVERVNAYGDSLQYVLIDWSMGKGKLLEVAEVLRYVRALKQHRPDLGIAIAGGLGPDTLHLIEPIVAEFPDTSIDAQSRLRPTRDAMDPVDWQLAGDYLRMATAMFHMYNR